MSWLEIPRKKPDQNDKKFDEAAERLDCALRQLTEKLTQNPEPKNG